MSKLFSWFKKDKQTDDETANAQVAETVEKQDSDTQDIEHLEADGKIETEAELREAEVLEAEIIEAEILDADLQDADESEAAELATDLESPVEQPEAKQEQQITETLNSETAAKQSFFARLKSSLSRTKANIGSGFASLLLGKNIDAELYEELETQLLVADVGMNTTNKIIDKLTEQAKRSQLKDGEALSALLQKQMQGMLDKVNKPLDFSIAVNEQGQKVPFVILMVGVNGVGKTTTIGKLAKQYQAQGKSVMLAAGDTFRAAAVEQLQVWGERNNIPVVAQHTGADSASVLYDAVASAQSKKVDVLIADTAGRLQNKDHLIEELKKVVRVMKKQIPNAPHEIMLTLDASTGQNAVSQTKIFNEAVGITGINLTKLDGSAKGGVIFALADEFNIPVRYIGIGEGIDDLREFDAKAFVEALFAE